MLKKFIKSHRTIRILSCKLYNLLKNGLIYSYRKGVTFSLGESTLINKIKIVSEGECNKIIIGNNCRLNSAKFILSGNANTITIGSNVSLYEVTLHTENDSNVIYIGNKTTIHGKTDISAIEGTKVSIGEDCMFSKDIYISSGDGHTILDQNHVRINPSKDILIGDHVWVGTQVIINKGSIVGNNSIVGAGAICTGKCDGKDGVIYAGNPALVVKSQIDWQRERV